MDTNISYPLVVIDQKQWETPDPIPVAHILVDAVDDESLDYGMEALWGCCSWLVVLICQLCHLLSQLRLDVIDLRCQAHYWQAMHTRVRQRETQLQEQVKQLQGEIRQLQQRLYGRTSESSTTTKPDTPTSTRNSNKRQRGQQSGHPGHGRRRHDHLPTTHETCVLPEHEQHCSTCGQPFQEIAGSNDGDILEIDVRAHRRRYHRQRYRCDCGCPGQAKIVSAPPPDKLIPKSNIGLSVWVLIVQRKYQFFQPLHRIVAELSGYDKPGRRYYYWWSEETPTLVGTCLHMSGRA